jgi:hypothetical protein
MSFTPELLSRKIVLPLVLIGSFLFFSCSGLNKTQIQATRNFASATRSISRIPSDIYFRIHQLKFEAQTLQLNTVLATSDSVKESIRYLKNDYTEKLKSIEMAEAFSTSYQIVEKYASLVLCLLDESYLREFNKSKDAWQINFDGLVKKYNVVAINKIPPSVGSLTSSVIRELGELRIKELQKKYLREAIRIARQPFENICDDFILLDSFKLRSELSLLPDYLDNNYADFLSNVRAYEKQGNNPYYYYKEYTPIYAGWLSQVDELTALASFTVSAFRSLKNAFGKLEEYVHLSNPGPMPDEVNSLMRDYSFLIETYNRFQYRREKLNAATLLK